MKNPDDHDLLIQVDTRLQGIEEKLDRHLMENGETIKNHELRIVTIETELAVFKSQVKIIGAVAAGIVSLISFGINAAFRFL